MESLFFNTPNQCYKISNKGVLEQVDISNGLLFFNIATKDRKKDIEFNYIDKMLFILLVERGEAKVYSKYNNFSIVNSSSALFVNSNTPFNITIKKDSKVFILFIADFFLKRYLSFKQNEPIDYVYNKILNAKELLNILQIPLDAFSLYLANKIKQTKECNSMQSIRCMYRCLEFIVHNLSMLDIIDTKLSLDDINLAKRAKDILLKRYVNPPTIKELAKECATNEFKLKKVFKSVYKSTIYSYIQTLRLKRANLLLKEENLTIKEVANSVGYSHNGHFAKLFFKTYGVYPKDIRAGT